MNTELICVGTELLEGKLNTNASYIGERLSTLGLSLTHIATVGDSFTELEEAINNAVRRSPVIILTGGLGATFDDITREAVSKVTGRKLALNREALSAIAAMFVKMGIDMPKNNERQAYLLEGGRLLRNPLGTAPGQLLELEVKDKNNIKQIIRIFLLPGPPREMQSMFEAEVFPYLKKYETIIRRSFILHVCGLGESLVDEKIKKIIDAERRFDTGSVSFTILAHQMIVDLKTSVSGKDEMLVDEMLQNIKNEFYEALGDNIYGEGKDTLESVAGGLLMKDKATIATAESCTGGLLAQKITSVQGSSFYFLQGFVTYANKAKSSTLGVSEEEINAHGAVSAETARAMSEGAKRVSGADYAVSITGIAGPGGGTKEKPVGLVYISLAGPDATETCRFDLHGSRSEVRERAANQALVMVRQALLKRYREKPAARTKNTRTVKK